MNRDRVTTTVALLLAAVLGLSYVPRKSTESTTGSQSSNGTEGHTGHKLKTAQARAEAAKLSDPCEEIVTRIQRFYPDPDHIRGPDWCYSEKDKPPTTATSGLHFVIALVPNPVQTHLSLLFDRSIEVIQQAAQDEGYSYDDSWFPWDETEKNFDSLEDQERNRDEKEQQQHEPGILVFRQGLSTSPDFQPYRSGLVVFLVGEQPTGGIREVQFEHALGWLQTLQPDPSSKEPLRILGPTFSGSFPSLARELIRNPPTAKLQIYSGTASSDQGVRWFRQFIGTRNADLTPTESDPKLGFRTYFESDSLMINRFLKFLRRQQYDLRRVAILSEDETAFGGNYPASSEDEEKASPIYLYYPRDIASLRSAYEKQSIFSAGRQQPSAPSTTLRGDLSEPANSEHDTARTYAGQLIPLAQESVLFGMSNILEANQIEFVILRGTSSLDQLFLSEFLRRSYPSGRIVIDGSDLLFRRGMQGASLRGVMTLSTYPLLTWTQRIVPVFRAERKESYRVFSEDLAEGLYIAARELMPRGGPEEVPISDYASPTWALGDGASTTAIRPATWISVVGHRQSWPIAVLNEDSQESLLVSASPIQVEDAQAKPFWGVQLPYWIQSVQKWLERGAPLPWEMAGLLIFSLALSAWHLYCCRSGSITGVPRILTYFAPLPKQQHTGLVLLGSLVLGVLGVVLLFACGLQTTILMGWFRIAVGVGVGAIVVAGFVSCCVNYRLPIMAVANSEADAPKVPPEIARWRRRALWVWVPALAASAVLQHYWLSGLVMFENARPTYWRNMYLRSGVSPLFPQVLLILGAYAWFWFTLHGLALFGEDQPALPRLTDLQKRNAGSEGPANARSISGGRRLEILRLLSQDCAGSRIEAAALPATANYWKSVVVFFVAGVSIFALALGEFRLRSLGDRRFGLLIFFWLNLSTAVVLADTFQLMRTWSRLRELLVVLDRLRLRRTLSALTGLSWGSIWMMGTGVLEDRYRLLWRQFESAYNLKNELRRHTPRDLGASERHTRAIRELESCGEQSVKFDEWYVNLRNGGAKGDITPLWKSQKRLAATAGCVMRELIVPAWEEESESLILNPGKSDGGSEPQGGAGSEQRDGKVEGYVRAAEEFFLLPYLGFIQNILGRLRTLAYSILTLFVAATLSVSSYPFGPLPVIGAIFLLLFVLIGGGSVLVYGQMHRNATLSHITKTRPGELGSAFWLHVFTFGVGPLIGLLTTLFPSMTDFVISWLQPGVESIK